MLGTPQLQGQNRAKAFKARWQTSSPPSLPLTTKCASRSQDSSIDRAVAQDVNVEFRKALKLEIEEHDNEIVRDVKDDAANAAIMFRNSLHSDLDKTYTENSNTLEALQDETSQQSTQLHRLYDNIAQPLAESICHSDHVAQGSLFDHLQALEAKIQEHEDNIARHEANLRQALKQEQALWDQLESLSSGAAKETPDQNLLCDHEKNVNDIVEKANRKITQIDSECRVAMNEQTMKVMDLMMAD